MATNLQIDDNLILRALKNGRHKTKKAAVTQTFNEYIERKEQMKILSSFGTIDHDPQCDYIK